MRISPKTKSGEKPQVAHSPSVAFGASSLPEGAYELVRFSAWCAEKTKEFFRTSKAKVCTFFFCGSAVRKHKPSSGRKVSRGSVTEGARETERQQKAAVFRGFSVNPSPASREPPLPQGSRCLCVFSFVPQRIFLTVFRRFPNKSLRHTVVCSHKGVRLPCFCPV